MVYHVYKYAASRAQSEGSWITEGDEFYTIMYSCTEYYLSVYPINDLTW